MKKKPPRQETAKQVWINRKILTRLLRAISNNAWEITTDRFRVEWALERILAGKKL